MDVFDLRKNLIEDYSSFIQSFINIRDPRIKKHVDDTLEQGALWPDPLIQLNPSFEAAGSVDELISQGILHPECANIFAVKNEDGFIKRQLKFHWHQEQAFHKARAGENYVLTTGTGSGKSLSYIVPIVDHVLRAGSGNGIQAIVVYPMNALANSQAGELEKFLCLGYPEGEPPVTFKRYTGQESDVQKREIINNPPDILLTNYVMLELILTRPNEKQIIESAQDLKFLVLDELHTYRGRQGADVAMLNRRVKQILNSPNLQCVGTSATMAGPGTYEEQQIEVATVATKLFGSQVPPENIIGERLCRATLDYDFEEPSALQQLKSCVERYDRSLPTGFKEFTADPLASWVETTFGLEREKDSGRLIRATPISINGEKGAAQKLNELTGEELSNCEKAITRCLMAGYTCEKNPVNGFPPFAFRLHQFISKGEAVYASIEDSETRYITLNGQQFVPGDRSKVLMPLCFCRECGQEYYSVYQVRDGKVYYEPRIDGDRTPIAKDHVPGLLYKSNTRPWPEASSIEEVRRVPEDWTESFNGIERVKKDRRKYLPININVDASGTQCAGDAPDWTFIETPFKFCLNCGVSYNNRSRSDYAKLTTLSSGGRSSATSILSLSSILHLRDSKMNLEKKARKLLSFTDNRQDASLQAGHFNDFIEIGTLRAALYQAVKKAGRDGLNHDELSQRVFGELKLPFASYAREKDALFGAKEQIEKSLRDVLGYRLYYDLRRGWRINAPNLVQCGLLNIEYKSLDELSKAETEVWANPQKYFDECVNPLLRDASPETRKEICLVLLNHLRQKLVIDASYLNAEDQERIRQRSEQNLEGRWSLDDDEKMVQGSVVFAGLSQFKGKKQTQGTEFLTPRSAFGQYLKRTGVFETPPNGTDDVLNIIQNLLHILTKVMILVETSKPIGEGYSSGYQIAASCMLWKLGDERAPIDPLYTPQASETGGTINSYFTNFYKSSLEEYHDIFAHEHTAQVPYEQREEREETFRNADLPILYCSPTMELGIDISQLNAVNMRNVPPTPANYAQRSGRAGRSGQPALVFTYCSTGSPHDQFFYRRPELMVSGKVSAPRLDLSNEDLIQSHVQAIWLGEVKQDLGSSINELLDMQDEKNLPILTAIQENLINEDAAEAAVSSAKSILATISNDLQTADWYDENWVESVVVGAPENLADACNRWRSLYLAAVYQRDRNHSIITDATRSREDKKIAEKLRSEAEAQIRLLLKENSKSNSHSDFYSYRYFASEGFLPGYNFPRLPLSAYVPGRRRKKGTDEYLSRPRFLAISEFGPRAIVYHEGSKYIISKVILPVDAVSESGDLATSQVKQCSNCGYLHPLGVDENGVQISYDNCQECNEPLGRPMSNLFRLENVVTRRRERINSDEEERLRLGYELVTGIRFAIRHGEVSKRVASIENGKSSLGSLTYGQAATLWRINKGWIRRSDKDRNGFVLDVEKGIWSSDKALETDDESAESIGKSTTRVIPYVDDRRNCLIFDPVEELSLEKMASLQAALKNAIQITFQLEDNELAAEPLPNTSDRKRLLFYESAEGGAGVLRQLVENPDVWSTVITKALEICHFDPVSGTDLLRAPHAVEDCEAACYNCLLSYGNQMDHLHVDRKLIRDYLLTMIGSKVSLKGLAPASTRSKTLKAFTGIDSTCSNWIDYMQSNDLCLPDDTGKMIGRANPDFIYESADKVALYIDGDSEDRASRDFEAVDDLDDFGYQVIRFGERSTWEDTVKLWESVFGEL